MALRWQSMGKAGAQLRIKTSDGETQVRLLRIPAGKPVPEHGHGGRELTVVLTGAFHDGRTVFGPGDVEEADASVAASADGARGCRLHLPRRHRRAAQIPLMARAPHATHFEDLRC